MELSLQMHFRSLPWRRKSANMTKNMQKINSLVRSGPATSFSLRHLALLWEALIIFYCFTHSQKYDETRTGLLTVSIINYSPMRPNRISYSEGASFCLQGLRPWSFPGLAAALGWPGGDRCVPLPMIPSTGTLGLSHPPQPGHMGMSPLACALRPRGLLDPAVPTVGASLVRWCGCRGRDGAEAGFGAVTGRQWGPPPQHPCTPSPSTRSF